MFQIPEQHRHKAGAAAIAMAIAAPCEGLRQWAYYDPPNILTVCRGHTGADVVKGRKYSLAECDAFFDADMRKAINIVDKCAPGLPDGVLAAFGDAVFNSGGKIACDQTKSTAARYLHRGQLIDACNQLPRWDKARVAGVMVPLPGLTKRRAAERDVCLQGLI
jgi:lysozyme